MVGDYGHVYPSTHWGAIEHYSPKETIPTSGRRRRHEKEKERGGKREREREVCATKKGDDQEKGRKFVCLHDPMCPIPDRLT